MSFEVLNGKELEFRELVRSLARDCIVPRTAEIDEEEGIFTRAPDHLEVRFVPQ